jgi:RNA 2',3'-cyclic 3'-phosphodiesterase
VKIFLGVPVGPAIESSAGALVRELQDRVAVQAPHARVSWVPPGRFHLTVLFIGHVSDGQLQQVRAALSRPFDVPSFAVAIEGAGTFPPHGKPRVLWAGCGLGRDAFVRLEREAYARVAAVVELEPERDATPHLTLARIKEPAELRAAALLAGLESGVLGTLTVDAVTLFESRPVRNGVEYVPVMATPLRPR